MTINRTSTFSDIMRTTDFAEPSNEDKSIKSSSSNVLYQRTGVNTTDAIQRKKDGATFIKEALNREYGPGFGQKVFDRANGYVQNQDLNSVVKGRNLALIDRTAATLSASETIDAMGSTLKKQPITGAQVQTLLSIIGDDRVADGKKAEAELLLRKNLTAITTLSGMKAALTANGAPLDANALDQLTRLQRPNGTASFTPLQRQMILNAPVSGGNTAQNRTRLLEQLPPGATVDDNGRIGGQTVMHKIAGDFPGRVNADLPRYVDVMKAIGDGQLSKDAITLTNGLMICRQANNDLYRMNITVTDGNNPSYNSAKERERFTREHSAGDVPKMTNNSVATALDTIGGNNPNVLKVLTAVVNQQFATPLVKGNLLPDGTNFNPNIPNLGANPDGVPFGDYDAVRLVHPGGIGAANIHVDKLSTGDFRIDISYPFVMGRPSPDHGSQFAGMGGTVVAATAKASFTINGEQAQQGVLQVTDDGSPTITWSGQMI